MLRPASEGHRDPLSTELDDDRPARNPRRSGVRPSPSRKRMDKGSKNSIRSFESMCWVDVYEEEYFGGRLTRLREGDHKTIKKTGSIIVGPDAMARCIDRKTNKVHHLQSRTVCPSTQFRRNHFPMRIEVVSAIAE